MVIVQKNSTWICPRHKSILPNLNPLPQTQPTLSPSLPATTPANSNCANNASFTTGAFTTTTGQTPAPSRTSKHRHPTASYFSHATVSCPNSTVPISPAHSTACCRRPITENSCSNGMGNPSRKFDDSLGEVEEGRTLGWSLLVGVGAMRVVGCGLSDWRDAGGGGRCVREKWRRGEPVVAAVVVAATAWHWRDAGVGGRKHLRPRRCRRQRGGESWLGLWERVEIWEN
ncbi:hypothetical protein Adt_46777 [Abeliophyllum distichum]|uniref:Uncharacterized protein n=1 Tax=Abeliophyllum distichum TaxID=126358 RepID=A0ABD1NZF9_9LAMI